MPQFVLKLKDVEDGREVRRPVPPGWLGGALDGSGFRANAAAGDGELVLTLHRSGADVVVTGSVRAGVIAECIRCLEDAQLAVSAEIGSLFTARGDGRRPAPDEEEASPEELVREFFQGEEIVLDDIVRDQIILEVPMQPLCREDCPGIEVPAHVRPPADFGVEEEEEIDPRLAPLRNLAVKAQNEE